MARLTGEISTVEREMKLAGCSPALMCSAASRLLQIAKRMRLVNDGVDKANEGIDNLKLQGDRLENVMLGNADLTTGGIAEQKSAIRIARTALTNRAQRVSELEREAKMAQLERVAALTKEKQTPGGSSASTDVPKAKAKAAAAPTAEGVEPATKAKAKPRAKPAAKVVDLSGIALQPEVAPSVQPECGEAWEKASHAVQDGLKDWRVNSLPPQLLQRLMEFVNKAIPHCQVLKHGRFKIAVTTRPKLSFVVPQIDGALGHYWWQQVAEDYGQVEPMPRLLQEVLLFYNDLYKQKWNHIMITLHRDGTCGIPPHQDKSHSKDSHGAVEDAAPLLDLSLGAVRQFVVLHAEGGDSEEDLDKRAICKFTMEHNSALFLPAFVNAECFHHVPLLPGALPRCSVLLRKVDKKFIHPTEARVRNWAGEWTDLVTGKDKTPVEVRRQDLAKSLPGEF